jgi:hypothetical protein
MAENLPFENRLPSKEQNTKNQQEKIQSWQTRLPGSDYVIDLCVKDLASPDNVKKMCSWIDELMKAAADSRTDVYIKIPGDVQSYMAGGYVYFIRVLDTISFRLYGNKSDQCKAINQLEEVQEALQESGQPNNHAVVLTPIGQ